MKELGITSLNIVADSEITLNSRDIGIIKTVINRNYLDDDDDVNSDDSKENEGSCSVGTVGKTKTSKRTFLTIPAITMARRLHTLLLNINKIPSQAPIMNPIKFDKEDSYVQFLLEKLCTKTREEFESDINSDYFIQVNELSNYEEEEEDKLEEDSIISEVNLLMLDKSFDDVKEETIKTLVFQLTKVYDNIIKEYVEVEIKRRKNFRSYIDFLSLYRKIEVYCNLYKVRTKGETIKNQTNNKIIEYSSQKIKQNDITNIIKAARRIEYLIKLSKNNYSIIDTFPSLNVSFFKSTSISVAAYECWLKIVESKEMISEEEGQQIYLEKKKKECEQRENNLREVYKSVAQRSEDYTYDVDLPRFFPTSEENSPRYYPTSDDDELPNFPMDEGD
jgi:hypothetical protein